tara:strand:+ start:470 stop:793 length:324 start_codon:yes stop_codon:yes gene_type:complete
LFGFLCLGEDLPGWTGTPLERIQQLPGSQVPGNINPNNSSGYPDAPGRIPTPIPIVPGNPARSPTEPEQIFGFPTPKLGLSPLDGEKNGATGRMTALAKRSSYSAAS